MIVAFFSRGSLFFFWMGRQLCVWTYIKIYYLYYKDLLWSSGTPQKLEKTSFKWPFTSFTRVWQKYLMVAKKCHIVSQWKLIGMLEPRTVQCLRALTQKPEKFHLLWLALGQVMFPDWPLKGQCPEVSPDFEVHLLRACSFYSLWRANYISAAITQMADEFKHKTYFNVNYHCT